MTADGTNHLTSHDDDDDDVDRKHKRRKRQRGTVASF